MRDGWTMADDTARQMKSTGKIYARLKCLKIKLQRSRLATDNLLKITHEEDIDTCVYKNHTQ